MVQLASEATAGVTGIAEGVHRSVWRSLGFPGGDAPGTTRGITGAVYRTIRGVTRWVGNGVGAVLEGVEPLFESADDTRIDTPRREAVLAVLNGVMGDRLVESENPFATPMTLRHNGTTGKIVLLIHGLCQTERQWHAEHDDGIVDHGEALAASAAYTPVHVRYNSGLHTSDAGRDLSDRLERLIAGWPVPVEDLSVVAHSMGGLVIRSAVHSGRQRSMHWPDRLKSIVFLGTPHHGAPLEKVGNWVDVALRSTPYTAPFARLAGLRSAGITDLRYGHVLEEDWRGCDRFQRTPDTRRVVPLPDGVACFAVAATTAATRGILADHVIGDGLVPVRSALGEHDDPRRDLGFRQGSRWIAYNTGHMELLSSPEVGAKLVQWIGGKDD